MSEESKCSKCNGFGWILYQKDDGFEYARECECQEVVKAKKRLEASGISEEFRKKGFKNFDDRGMDVVKTAKAISIDYCKRFLEIRNTSHNSILFMGQVGSGKTHLSMAICNALLERYAQGVIYMPYREEILNLKQKMVADPTAYQDKIRQFKECPVLMIDDLLKGKNTESDVNILFEIINYRYINCLPMIVSTEKTQEQLLDFDEGTMSRIIERSMGHLIEIVGRQYNYRIKS